MRKALAADCVPCLVSYPPCVAWKLDYSQDTVFPTFPDNPRLISLGASLRNQTSGCMSIAKPTQAVAQIRQGPAWCDVIQYSDAIGAATYEMLQLCLAIQSPLLFGLHLLILHCWLVQGHRNFI